MTIENRMHPPSLDEASRLLTPCYFDFPEIPPINIQVELNHRVFNRIIETLQIPVDVDYPMCSKQISLWLKQLEDAQIPQSLLTELKNMRWALNEETTNLCPCDGPLDGLPEVRKHALLQRYIAEGLTGWHEQRWGVEGGKEKKRRGLLKAVAAILSCLQESE